MKTKLNFLFLSLFSGLLLSVAWYLKLSVVIFFALVPLLLLEHRLSQSEGINKRRFKLWLYSYITFLTWNILVTWWVVYASLGGACMAFFCNALLMSFVFLIYSGIKNRLGKSWGPWVLIPLWLAWEHGHTLWDISWTWLTIGNVFAFNHNWIQWFEITGTSGGSAWALAVNILIFITIKNNASLKIFSRPVLKIAAAIILPILVSYAIVIVRSPLSGDSAKRHVLVVQPNIDPYNTKFSLDFQSQFYKFLSLVRGKITPATDYLVLPETFITENFDEATMAQSEEVKWFVDSLLKKFPDLKIVTGGNTYVVYPTKEDATATARFDEQSNDYYDAFNTGLMIDQQGLQMYHKSKLVPGVERMPFPALFRPLEKFAINMGGTMGSLGMQDERGVFTDKSGKTVIAPVICYESVYGDYLTEYIRKKANLIFIITNDGWWEDTPGYIQHLNYARLRAIENRRQIARSANTGTSCFIDEFGNISDATAWWEEAVIEKDMYVNDQLTFFSRFGDLLSYVSVVLSFGFMLLAMFLRFKR
ncbi:MAG: apolipoprotein N-acyltransferase [Bacteroidota bacterium]